MFGINFDPSSMRVPREALLERLATASEMNLRYGYFQADVSLTVNDSEVDRFYGITVLDL